MATIQNLNFIPTSISGCSLWLDSTDLSTLSLTGTSVTEWRDKSGNNKNFTATTGNPSLISDSGRNVLDFPSGVVMSSSSTITFTSTPFFFVVAKVGSISAAGTSMLLSVATDYSIRFNSSGLNGTPATPGNTGDLGNSNYYVTGNFNPNYALSVYTSNYNIIGTAVASNGGGTTTFTLSSTFMSRFFIGRISEVILYPTLTVAQRQQVEGYLAWKWGIQSSLPTSHPYYRIAPNSAGLGYPTNIPVSIPAQALVPSSAPLVFFNPSTVSGIQIWLDGADPTTFSLSGSNITQWRDKSGNGYNFNTSTGTPTYANNTVTIPSGAILTSAINLALTTSSYVFIVSLLTTTNFAMLLAFPNITVSGGSAGDYSIRYNISILLGTVNSPGNANDFANSNYYVNGTFNPSFTASTYTSRHSVSGQSTQSGTTSITLSSNFGTGTRPFIGNIYEVLFYSSVPSSTQRQQIEGYLAWKWGFQSSLPSNHPFKNAPPGLTVPVSIPTLSLQPASFSPKNVSGLQLWLDAADTSTVVLSGVNVSLWNDKSGNGNNFTNSGTVTYASNALTFNSSSMTRASFTGLATGNTTPLTVFIILNCTSVSGTRGVFNYGEVGASNRGIVLFIDTDSKIYGTTYFSNFLISTSISTNTRIMVCDNVTYNGTAGNFTRSGFLNGSAFSTTNSTVTTLNLQSSAVGLGTTAAGQTFVGSINEVLYYNSTITTTQRQNIEGYLAWKWGLQGSLPSNHPFKKFPPSPN